jgi:serine/threonine protein kinase
MSGYVVVRELGRGASGVVSLVRRKHDGRLFAAKEINFVDQEERNQIMAEVRVMQSLPQHPSLLSLEEVLQTRSAVTMIVEYSAEGTLRDALYGTDAGGGSTSKVHQGFSEEHVVRYLTQLVNAVGFMHQHEVLHRDIKLENLLLFSQKSVVKVSDFGVATILGRTTTGTERMAQTTAGTPHYMSPEVCEGHPYGYKSDVWSLGIVAYEMCTTAVPFQASNMLALSGKICHQATPDLPMEYSRRLDSIIKAMLTKNQSTRPSVKDVTAMLQYYRRKRTDQAPDGRDIGGFAVDSHITPNDLFDDMTDNQEGGGRHHNGPTQSWGAPSVGLPEDDWGPSDGCGEDPLAGFDDGTGSHYGGRSGGVTPQPRQDTNSGSVFASSAVLEATRNSEPDTHAFSVKQAATDQPRTGGHVTAQQRSAIFLEARRQAAENKRNAEHELQRVQQDNDEEAVKASRTPRLRTLVEEMQEELRKQTQNVDAMMARYGTGRYDHVNDNDDELPHESHLQKPLRSITPPAKPFVDPASHTPSAVRKSISPNRPRGSGIDESASPLYSPREAVDSPVSPNHKSSGSKGAMHPTPPQSSNGAHQPLLPANRRDGGKSPPPPAHIHLAGGAKPTPQSTPRVQPAVTKPPTPASKPPSATSSPASGNKIPRIVVRNATLVNNEASGSFDASTSGKDQTYFPPCAHCMKSAKERRQSVAASPPPSDPSHQIFLTIHPSKYYCSTCHAPLCDTCHLTVHDPMTTITNLSPLGGGGGGNMSASTLSASMKRHNVFYLTVFDPSASVRSPPQDVQGASGPAGRVSPTAHHGHLQTLEAEKKSAATDATTCGCTIM